MNWKTEWKPLAAITAVFAACFYLPIGDLRFDNALSEALSLVRSYAREHVLLCLIPAFFIAGAISATVRRESVMRYLGPRAHKGLAYGVASVSGSILAVCSCTVLPLFAGIYRMGAGLGPATAFLYSGPAINVLAIVLTARVLGWEIGLGRAIGAVAFSIIIGLLMHLLHRREEKAKVEAAAQMPEGPAGRPLGQTAALIATLVGILVFANLARPESGAGAYAALAGAKWPITGALSLLLGVMLVLWMGIRWWKVFGVGAVVATLALALPGRPLAAFTAGIIGLSIITSNARGEAGEWFAATWGFAKQILPLLLVGVLIAGALLGRPGQTGLLPSNWINSAVGGNTIWANLFAAVAGAFMYFATLTEVPIVQGLLGSGMGGGPALALLLAGPALSLPNMLVIRSVLGTKKTLVYICLVVVMATASGLLFGRITPTP